MTKRKSWMLDKISISKHYHKIILFFILLLSFILRVYRLGFREIWYDEARSLATASKSLFLNLHPDFSYKPLYFILLKLWVYFFGVESEPLRMLSVIFGVLGVFVMYKLGKLIWDKRLGLVSSFLLCISCFHIYHSQQVRHFTFLTFLVLLSFYYFISIFVVYKRKYFIYNTTLNILVLFVHPYGILAITVQAFLALLLFRSGRLKQWFLYNLYTLGGVILWFIMSNKARLVMNTWWISKPNFQSLVHVINTFTYGGFSYGLQNFILRFEFPIVISFLCFSMLVFFILGLVYVMGRDVGKGIILLAWFLGYVLASYIFSLLFFPVFVLKHLIGALPPFLILVAAGMCFFRKIFRVGLLVLLIGILSIFPLEKLYTEFHQASWGRATQYLKEHIDKEDVIIINPVCQLNTFLYYFRKPCKNILEDMDVYGKVTPNGVKQVFKEHEHLVIGIKQLKILGVEYLTKEIKDDFLVDSELKLNRLNMYLGKKDKRVNIWVLADKWSFGNPESTIISLLMKNYNLEFSKKFSWLNFYKFCEK